MATYVLEESDQGQQISDDEVRSALQAVSEEYGAHRIGRPFPDLDYGRNESVCATFFDGKNGFYVPVVDEAEKLRRIRSIKESQRIVPITGVCGCGKTTLLSKFLYGEIQAAKAKGNAVGMAALNFRALMKVEAESMSFKGEPISGTGLDTAIYQHLREMLRDKYLPHEDQKWDFINWLCENLSKKDEGSTSAFGNGNENFCNWFRDEITDIMATLDIDPRDRQLRRDLLTNDPAARMPSERRRRILGRARSRFIIHYLLETRVISEFYIVFDNVDELPHWVQPRLWGVVHSIRERGPERCFSFVTMRSENLVVTAVHEARGLEVLNVPVDDPEAYSDESRPDGNINTSEARDETRLTTDRLAQGQPLSQELESVEANAPIASDTRESAAEARNQKYPLASVALSRRFLKCLMRAEKDNPDVPSAAFDVLRDLHQAALKDYFNEQFYGLLNKNMRDLFDKHIEYLRFVIENRIHPLHKILKAEGRDRSRMLTSLLYVWLHRGSAGTPPFHITNLVVQHRLQTGQNISCFIQHLILARLDNWSHAHAREGNPNVLMTVRELAQDLQNIGFRDHSIMAALRTLIGDQESRTHLVERRPVDWPRDSIAAISPDDRVWISERGRQCLHVLPFKFYSLLEGARRLVPGFDPTQLSNERRFRIAIGFMIDLMTYYLTGLRNIARALRTRLPEVAWAEYYEPRFCLLNRAGTNWDFQFDRLCRSISRYCEQHDWMEKKERVDQLRREWENQVKSARLNRFPDINVGLLRARAGVSPGWFNYVRTIAREQGAS